MKLANRQLNFGLSSILFFLLASACISACRHSTGMMTAAPVRTDTPPVVQEEVQQRECTVMPTESFDLAYLGVKNDSIFDFYVSRSFNPFWIRDRAFEAKADSMIAMIRTARFYGLLPQNYHLQELEIVRIADDCASQVRLDVLLTDAFLTMASDLKNGRLRNLPAKPLQFGLLTDMSMTRSVRTQLESQEPNHSGYNRLKSALRNILDTVANTQRDLLLRGVTIDSIPVHRKIQMLEINLERWRWEKDLPDDYVWVNIPGYRVSVFEDDSLVLESRVIVGAPETPTPVLSSLIECFIVYPYWHVPRKIAVEEYLPVIKKDISFITANNFEVLDRKGNVLGYDTLDWAAFSVNYFPVMLRQREGTDNALGVVKFSFDNRYAVYLHDTNAKRLFQRDKRALSHGCIRMENAVDLAHYLARTYTKKYSPEDIDRYIRLKQKHTVDLVSPLPVYLCYFTCESDGNILRMYSDIYSRDKSLISSLYKASFSF